MSSYQFSKICALSFFYFYLVILYHRTSFGQIPQSPVGPQMSPAAVSVNNPGYGPQNIPVQDNPQIFTGTGNNPFYGGEYC